jgi:hypothetical protein
MITRVISAPLASNAPSFLYEKEVSFLRTDSWVFCVGKIRVEGDVSVGLPCTKMAYIGHFLRFWVTVDLRSIPREEGWSTAQKGGCGEQ